MDSVGEGQQPYVGDRLAYMENAGFVELAF
jgi:hypothetical protein